MQGHVGGSAAECLPLAQGVMLSISVFIGHLDVFFGEMCVHVFYFFFFFKIYFFYL